MEQSSLYCCFCCFLFIQHQSMLDQAEQKMRPKKNPKKRGHSRCNRAQSTKGCYHFIT